MKVGTVVQVKSFSDYIVRAPVDPDNGYIMASAVPVGAYVSIKSAEGMVVGVVSDVLHSVKEEYLPYLPREKQDIFLPYMNDMRNSYIVVHGIGHISNGRPAQSLAFTPVINDVVEVLGPAEIRMFHKSGNGKASFAYYRSLANVLDPAVVSGAIDCASGAMPECVPMLKALKKFTENKR